MDAEKYTSYQESQLDRFEALCGACGECCGALDGDPCANLIYHEEINAYSCADYANRLGPQKTRSGNVFTCVPIREHIKNRTLRERCAYWALLK